MKIGTDDKWGPSLSLKSEFPSLFSSALAPSSKVALNFNKTSNLWTPKLARPLTLVAHSELLNLMNLLCNFSPTNTRDLPYCSWLSAHHFSAKTVYEILSLSGVTWKHARIWKLRLPPKIKFFLWKILIGKINTKDTLIRRGLPIQDPLCAFCSSPEIIDHLFLNCSALRPLWVNTCIPLSPEPIPLSVDLIWSSWSSSLSKSNQNLWNLQASALSWTIWSERNNRIFLNSSAEIQSLLGSAQEVLSSWNPAASS